MVTKLVAVDTYGIYTSSNSGVTWSLRHSTVPYGLFGVASSADGSKLVVVSPDGAIFTSADSGQTWAQPASGQEWMSAASSADGTKLVAAAIRGQIWTSTDSGATWTPHASVQNWRRVASSADGSKLIAGALGGTIWTSADYGTNWTPRGSVGDWAAVATSADGNKLVAASMGGQIYTSSYTPISPTNPPVILGATNQVLDATSANGVVATFDVTATNWCQPNVPVTCTPPSGSLFPLGTNTVTCVAVDALGNIGSTAFTIWVRARPSVTALAVSLSGTNAATGSPGAVLSAEVNPHGLAATAFFQYGLNTSYAGSTTPVGLPGGYNSSNVLATLEGLLGGATYHWRAVGSNSLGTDLHR